MYGDNGIEYGWLIELPGVTPMWWNGMPKRDGNGAWSSESTDGIRFSRKCDAELCAIAQGFKLSKVIATDHQWG